jgi:predicted nucleotidyltransferase
MLGVTPEQIEILRAIFSSFLPDVQVWVFGSRVAGPIKPSSDLDVALYSPTPISLQSLALLENALQESHLPFRVDCLDTARITPEFRDVIERNRERFL